MIQENKIRPFFFFTILAIIASVVGFIFLPFLGPLLLAGALAIVFRPLHKTIRKKTKTYDSLSALITVLIILLLVVLPITLLAGQLFIEAKQFYISITDSETDNGLMSDLTTQINTRLQTITPFLSIDLNTVRSELVDWLVSNFNDLFSRVAYLALDIFVFCFGLFYLIRDGDKFKKALVKISPLGDTDDLEIFAKIKATINSVFVGSLLIALVQGLLTTIGFMIFDVPQPVLWGALGVILSLIPNVGPSLLFIPAILWQFSTGNMVAVIGLTIWGMVIVASSDNILRPYLIERGMKVHPFLILVSVLGGLIAFGPIGFLLGPVLLSLLFALLTIYADLTKNQ